MQRNKRSSSEPPRTLKLSRRTTSTHVDSLDWESYVVCDQDDKTTLLLLDGDVKLEEEFEYEVENEDCSEEDENQDIKEDFEGNNEAEGVRNDVGGNPSSLQVSWSNQPPLNKPKFEFSGSPGLKIHPPEPTICGFFHLLFTEEFFENIVQETNNLAEKKLNEQWSPITVLEFKKFLGLYFTMGVVKMDDLDYYWSTKLISLPYFKHMSRDTFCNILKFVQFSSSAQGRKSTNPLERFSYLIEFFHKRMDEIHEPGENISIYESQIAPWKARSFFIWKRKVGLQLYMLTEEDGLVHRILIYAGPLSKDVESLRQAQIVLKLLNGLTGVGRCLYMDKLNSVDLAHELLNRKTYVTGVLAKSKNNPPSVERAQLSHGQVFQQWSTAGVNVSKWKDVRVISSKFSGNLTGDKKQPESVMQYNSHGGVGSCDDLLFECAPKAAPFPCDKRMSLHILDIMLLNSYLLYKRYAVQEKSVDLFEFRSKIVQYLCDPTPINVLHFPSYPPENVTEPSVCRICDSNDEEMIVYCLGCDEKPALCLNSCFIEYHRKQGFEII